MRNQIGEKISWSKQDDELIVKIPGSIESWMLSALAGWVVVWLILGGYILNYMLFNDLEDNVRVFFAAYLVFWGYFAYKTVYAFLFKWKGYELIRLNGEGCFVARRIFGSKPGKQYLTGNIKRFELNQQAERSFAGVYQKSFWVVGGEAIGFDYPSKRVSFGIQLEEADAKAVVNLLNKHLKKVK